MYPLSACVRLMLIGSDICVILFLSQAWNFHTAMLLYAERRTKITVTLKLPTVSCSDPAFLYLLSSAQQYSTGYYYHVLMFNYYVTTYSLISKPWTNNVPLNEVKWRMLLSQLLYIWTMILVLCWRKEEDFMQGSIIASAKLGERKVHNREYYARNMVWKCI
jgi:hypothetical protein